jgi:hypothetical protein
MTEISSFLNDFIGGSFAPIHPARQHSKGRLLFTAIGPIAGSHTRKYIE